MTVVALGTLVNALEPAGTGINDAFRGVVRTSEKDVTAYVKKLGTPREVLVEVACAVIARQGGLPVPMPMLVFVPDHLGGPALGFGSESVGHRDLGIYIEAGHGAAVRDRLGRWPGLLKAACFDEWIANCDRHPRNLLFDGGNEFWLIDHGLAINPALLVDQLAPRNQLFEVAVRDRADNELTRLRPVALGIMEALKDAAISPESLGLPVGVWSDEESASVVLWLVARQGHLMRLASERIPAMQSEMFDGRLP